MSLTPNEKKKIVFAAITIISSSIQIVDHLIKSRKAKKEAEEAAAHRAAANLAFYEAALGQFSTRQDVLDQIVNDVEQIAFDAQFKKITKDLDM